MMMRNRLGHTKTFVILTLCALISASVRSGNLSPSNMPDMDQKTTQSMVNTSQQMTVSPDDQLGKGMFSPEQQMRQVMFRPGEQMVSHIQPISPGHPVRGVLS